MKNFEYYTPTNVIFGKETEMQVGELIKQQGCKKVLVHFGGSSAKRSGLLDRITEALEGQGVEFITLGGVVPNPRLSLVYEGIELCKKENVDFILAVGGGSVIDSAKAIGYGLAYDGDVWDFYDQKATPVATYPVGCVLTIAAAGSEMSNSSVITREEGGIKRGLKCELCRPKFAILNPELTYTLPEYQTSCGVTDIIMHTFERYFTTDESMDMTDAIAEGLIKVTMKNGKILLNDSQNYKARAEIMWAGSLSHNNLTGLGVTDDWATHQLEHELSGLFDVAHGAGLAAVWGTWARYVCDAKPERFVTFAEKIFGITEGEDDEIIEMGIRKMEEFFTEIKMPISIPELLGRAITEEEIDELTEKCAHHGRSIGAFKSLNKEDIKGIYNLANM